MASIQNTIPKIEKFDYNSLRWQPNRMVIIGKTGSGKTYICKKIITSLQDVYERVYFFLPTGLHHEYLDLGNTKISIRIVEIDSYEQITTKIEEIKKERLAEVIDVKDGKSVFKGSMRWCLVFDNIMRTKLCKSDIFGNLFFASRHLELDLIFISQYAFKYLENAHKENTSHFFLLKNNFTLASKMFYNEIIRSGLPEIAFSMNEDLLNSISKSIVGSYIVRKEHGCLVCDENNNKLYYL